MHRVVPPLKPRCLAEVRLMHRKIVFVVVGITALAYMRYAVWTAEIRLAAAAPADTRFEVLDVFVDSGDRALAAYQFELSAESGSVQIVGIEGGEHAAFSEPPYYDPVALSEDRVILAAFSTGEALPKGKTRVARVHTQVSGPQEPNYVARLTVSASADGVTISADTSVAKGEAR